MKPHAYLLNLGYTIAFLYSLIKVSDGAGYFWLGTLILSTAVLTVIFLTHCYKLDERE